MSERHCVHCGLVWSSDSVSECVLCGEEAREIPFTDRRRAPEGPLPGKSGETAAEPSESCESLAVEVERYSLEEDIYEILSAVPDRLPESPRSTLEPQRGRAGETQRLADLLDANVEDLAELRVGAPAEIDPVQSRAPSFLPARALPLLGLLTLLACAALFAALQKGGNRDVPESVVVISGAFLLLVAVAWMAAHAREARERNRGVPGTLLAIFGVAWFMVLVARFGG